MLFPMFKWSDFFTNECKDCPGESHALLRLTLRIKNSVEEDFIQQSVNLIVQSVNLIVQNVKSLKLSVKYRISGLADPDIVSTFFAEKGNHTQAPPPPEQANSMG